MASCLKLTPVAVALTAVATFSAFAQTAPQRLDTITVTGKAEPLLDVENADVSGFGAALAKTPQSVSVLTANLLTLNAVQSLSQLLKLDASLADSYNTTGYIESLSIRGFLLDQNSNFSRNGLAISNYVPIALESMDRVEVLKGVAGLQSGVSAPGGLVNYVTKVPLKEAFSSTTAQVALNHRLNADWKARIALSTQTTLINDRLAFPDGCSSAAVYVYPGLCGNGDVDVYDYRSEGERRTLSSWDAHIDGKFKALGSAQAVRFGMSGRSARADLPAMQAYNWVGTTNIYTPLALPADPSLTVLNTDSRERALEGYATLTSDLSRSVQSFVGLRVSRLSRSSELSDGTQAAAYEQTLATPWAGLAWSPSSSTMVYASWGQGVELEVVPNRPMDFANYGQTLPALKSEQTEIGLKWQANPRLLLTAAAFNIA